MYVYTYVYLQTDVCMHICICVCMYPFVYVHVLGGTLYHKYCAKLLQAWGGELGNTLQPASGLNWENTGTTKIFQGQQLTNSKLAKALSTTTTFTQKEYNAFDIGNVRHDDFIKSGESYFKPIVDRGTEQGEQFMEDLKSISIKEVRLLISNLIEQGLDRRVPNRLSEQELSVVMSATVQHMPLILQLHERTATISTHFQELSDGLSLEVEELRSEMLSLVNMLILGDGTQRGRTSRKSVLDGT